MVDAIQQVKDWLNDPTNDLRGPRKEAVERVLSELERLQALEDAYWNANGVPTESIQS